jgi:hypothetical protein
MQGLLVMTHRLCGGSGSSTQSRSRWPYAHAQAHKSVLQDLHRNGAARREHGPQQRRATPNARATSDDHSATDEPLRWECRYQLRGAGPDDAVPAPFVVRAPSGASTLMYAPFVVRAPRMAPAPFVVRAGRSEDGSARGASSKDGAWIPQGDVPDAGDPETGEPLLREDRDVDW